MRHPVRLALATLALVVATSPQAAQLTYTLSSNTISAGTLIRSDGTAVSFNTIRFRLTADSASLTTSGGFQTYEGIQYAWSQARTPAGLQVQIYTNDVPEANPNSVLIALGTAPNLQFFSTTVSTPPGYPSGRPYPYAGQQSVIGVTPAAGWGGALFEPGSGLYGLASPSFLTYKLDVPYPSPVSTDGTLQSVGLGLTFSLGATNTTAGTLAFANSGNVYFTAVAVPEPPAIATLLAGGLLLAGPMARRRSHVRRASIALGLA